MRTILCVFFVLNLSIALKGQSLRGVNLNKYKYIVIDDVSGVHPGETRRFAVKNLAIAGYKIVNLSEPLKTYDDYPNDLTVNKNLALYLSVNSKLYGCFEVEIRLFDYKNREVYKNSGSSCGLLSNAVKNAIRSLSQYNYKFDERQVNTVESEVNIPKADRPNQWTGNGSGFFIDGNGLIATNSHVVYDAKEIEVEFVRNGFKEKYPAIIMRADKINDLAILKIEANEFMPFKSLPYNFKTEIMDLGAEVFTLGYPMALFNMGTDIKYTNGTISSKTGFQGSISEYQISVPIQPGNSGGPLFDADGSIVGLTSAGFNRSLDITENVNYAIKSVYLKTLIDIACPNVVLPRDTTISNKNLTEKLRILSEYVVLVKTR